jgi:hypothetical protein
MLDACKSRSDVESGSIYRMFYGSSGSEDCAFRSEELRGLQAHILTGTCSLLMFRETNQ